MTAGQEIQAAHEEQRELESLGGVSAVGQGGDVRKVGEGTTGAAGR